MAKEEKSCLVLNIDKLSNSYVKNLFILRGVEETLFCNCKEDTTKEFKVSMRRQRIVD